MTTVPLLVTGAAGSLGRAIVTRLVADGHHVRAFVRRTPERELSHVGNPGSAGVRPPSLVRDFQGSSGISKGHRTPEQGVQSRIEYCVGDLADPQAVDRAVRGVHTVIHAGAATKGDWDEHRRSTVMGTSNVIASCQTHQVGQLVHISSMSVIDWAGSVDNGPVDESAALEPRASERGAYTRAKLEAETLVTDASTRGLPCVILRPGQIFGGGIALINGAVARNVRSRWLVLGDGRLELPLVYIDDVVDAIVAAVDRKITRGDVIHIIDSDCLTQEEVLSLAGGDKPIVRVPRPIAFAVGKLSELPLRALGKRSPVGAYRLKSALARLHYASTRAHDQLGWQPRVGVREGIRRVMSNNE